MNKGLVTLLAGVGGTIGGYIPVLLGASGLAGWNIVGGFIGGIAGIWLAVKMSQ